MSESAKSNGEESKVDTAGTWTSWAVRVLLLLAAPLGCAWLIGDNAINAPFLDDFMTVGLMKKVADGTWTLHDFFAAQMEHRIAWTRLVMLVFHKLWPGHYFLAQIWYNWVLFCLTLFNVGLLLRRTTGEAAAKWWWLLVLASLCLFSPVQFNIILWPFMHQVVTLAFLLTAAVLVWTSNWAVWLRFVLGLLYVVLAMLSFTSGILLWMVLAPVIWWSAPMPNPKARKLVTVLWGFACAVSLGLYFHDLKNEVDPAFSMGQGQGGTLKRDISEFMEDPLKGVNYTLRILGNPLVRGQSMDLMDSSVLMGALMLVLYLGCLIWWLKRFKDREFVRAMTPWLAIGAYSIGAAFAVTVGRIWIGFTGAYALSTRYVIHAVPLTVALPVLIWMACRDAVPRSAWLRTHSQRLFTAGATLMIGLQISSWAYGVHMMEAWSSSRMRGATSTLFYKVKTTVEHDYPDGPGLAVPADDLHLLHPPMLKTRMLSNFSIQPSPLNATFAACTAMRTEPEKDGMEVVLDGHAILKKHWRPADGVFISFLNGEGQWEIIHVTHVTGLPLYLRKMIMRDLEFMHEPPEGVYQSLSHFNARFKLSELPAGRWKLAAWAYDYETNHVAVIPGFFEIDTSSGLVMALGEDPDSIGLSDYVKTTRKHKP